MVKLAQEVSLEFELIKVRTLLPPMFPEAGRKVGMVMAFIREAGLALVAGGQGCGRSIQWWQ